MTLENVKALPDSDLRQVIAWAQNELKARAEKRKQETIAKIKELAGLVGVSVSINGQRGRPPKAKSADNGSRKPPQTYEPKTAVKSLNEKKS